MKTLPTRRAILAWLPFGLAPAVRAQSSWPERPITLVVPFGPGGIADLTARTVAQAMSATLKVPIVIDNKPSAGSIVGSAAGWRRPRPTATRCC